jgi:hypothetical protein
MEEGAIHRALLGGDRLGLQDGMDQELLMKDFDSGIYTATFNTILVIIGGTKYGQKRSSILG